MKGWLQGLLWRTSQNCSQIFECKGGLALAGLVIVLCFPCNQAESQTVVVGRDIVEAFFMLGKRVGSLQEVLTKNDIEW